jgi:hypothetical protein
MDSLKRRGRKGIYTETREWLEAFRPGLLELDVAIQAAEREQDRALRITSVFDGVGGGHGGGNKDKIGTAIANYDALMPYLRGRVKDYATAIAERMEAIDSVSRPESREILWRQYINGEQLQDVAAYFGISRSAAYAWGAYGLREIAIAKGFDKQETQKQKPQA